MTFDNLPLFTIRDASRDDLAAITAIYADEVATGTASFELDPPDLGEMTSRFEALKADGFPYLVAEKGGEVLGYAYAGYYRPRRAYRFTLEDSVYVGRDARGLGVGRKLLEALIAACEAGGWRQMIAVISDSATSGASVALHAACGFAHTGTLHDSGYKFGKWLDVTLMQRTLGAGAGDPPPEGR